MSDLDKENCMSAALISVVVPLFNEEDNLPDLYRRLTRSLEGDGELYELIFVNDGSRDRTAALLEELHQNDGRVVVVHLSRNFGHQAAISAGIDQARGQAVILMDGDLQDPPEVLGQFIATWRQGYEVVYAIRTKRKEVLWKRCAYALFYRTLRAVSDIDIPLDSGDFCLMDRIVVDAIKKMSERQRFVRGLRSFAGYRQTGVRYERAARQAGQPKYTFRSLVRLAMDGLIGFSAFPLALIMYVGLGTMGLSFVVGGWLAVTGVVKFEVPAGWALTLWVVLAVGGMNLLSLGIIGQYVRRIFLETKGRPTYIIGSLRQKEVASGTKNERMAA
jgi:glycosyltransferase involved in cell wall biosynthesis